MGKTQRLDKFLVHMGVGTRSQVRDMCKRGLVTVDGQVIKDSACHVDPTRQSIQAGEKSLAYQEFFYFMLHKPQGVISATDDPRHRTVLDLLDPVDQKKRLFPVGRLDIDTEGLLLLTNDGQLAHQLLSPRKHVPKIYYAHIAGEVTEADRQAFAAGIVLEDGYRTLPAELSIIESGAVSRVELVLYEGKFHQVKRMFQMLEKPVTYLKRRSMGTLVLDPTLAPGDYRELTAAELAGLVKGMEAQGEEEAELENEAK